MNQDLIKYVECVKDHENIVYKYEEIINTLAIPEVIDKPLVSNVATPIKVGKLKYIIISVLLFNMTPALGILLEQKFPELIAQGQSGDVSAIITFFSILLAIIIIPILIPWLFYARKKRKAKKEYMKQKQADEAFNMSELNFYKKSLAEEEQRLNTENAVKEKLRKRLNESKKVLNQLYDVGIIFPKYRNFTSINMICEYLQSGRCDKLTGSDGAYNLYESELRANIIIEKLDDIIISLDDIKYNQSLIYSAIRETNTLLNAISEEMEEINESAHIAAFNSEAIARETETIGYLTYFETIKNY